VASYHVCAATAKGGHLEVLKWLKEVDCLWVDYLCCVEAAQGGHLEVLKWLREYGFPFTGMAAVGGHLEVLKWLRENDWRWDEGEVCTAAAEEGHLEVLKWLGENGRDSYARSCAKAAAQHFEVLKWASEMGCPWDGIVRGIPAWDKSTKKREAARGRLKALLWLRENDYPRGDLAHHTIRNIGSFQAVGWLKKVGCLCTDGVWFNDAAQEGNLEVLQWFRENDGYSAWDERTFSCAVQGGQLEVMKWLHEIGCPFDEYNSVEDAVRAGGLEELKWLRDHGAPWPAHLELAVPGRHFEVNPAPPRRPKQLASQPYYS